MRLFKTNIFSISEWPDSVRDTDFCFSSITYNSLSLFFLIKSVVVLLTFRYKLPVSFADPDIINGVLASSINTESTSSIIA